MAKQKFCILKNTIITFPKMIFLLLIILFAFLLTGCKKEDYKVLFIDWDGSVLLETSLPAGTKITPPNNPLREGYEFIGWDKTYDLVKSDTTIKALYEMITCTVTFLGYEDDILKEEVVSFNSSATAPQVTPPLGYEFSGWDKEYTLVKNNLTVKAEFTRLSYKVNFYDDLGNLIKEETVYYNDNAPAPQVDSRDDEEFSHWNGVFTNVTNNLDIYAVFKVKEYTLSFYDGSTKLSLGVNSYKKTDDFLLPIPTKTGYIFAGWFLSDISLYEVTFINPSLKGNLTFYSRWVKVDQNEITIPTNTGEFVQINKNLHSNGVSYVYQPQFPSGAQTTSVTAYDWVSSNSKVATISAYSSISIAAPGYAIISATLKTNPSVVYYCVIQTSADGVKKATIEEANAPSYVTAFFKMTEEETVTKIVAKGGFATPPPAPHKEGYIFTGWVGANQETTYNITKDTLFLPTYTIGPKTYAGKTISILGDSITTYNSYIPNGFAYFYPYPTADLADVNQTWWMQFINHYGMSLLANNAWSGSAVAGDASSAARKLTRLQHLYIGEVKPDVILIFMGANDAPSQYISLNQFDLAYNEMILNIKSVSPNSEIILCTLPPLPLYTQSDQDTYNEVIIKYADLYNFTLLDFSTAFLRADSSLYLVDSAHPNKEGMNKLALKAINDFYEQNK